MNLTTCDTAGCHGVAQRRICETNLCRFCEDLMLRYRPKDLTGWLRGLKADGV